MHPGVCNAHANQEIGNSFPDKSFISGYNGKTADLTTSAVVSQQNYSPAEEGETCSTQDGFSRVKALCVLLVLLNTQCHKGEINGLLKRSWYGGGGGGLNLPSHLRFRLSESRPCPWWLTSSSLTVCVSVCANCEKTLRNLKRSTWPHTGAFMFNHANVDMCPSAELRAGDKI